MIFKKIKFKIATIIKTLNKKLSTILTDFKWGKKNNDLDHLSLVCVLKDTIVTERANCK